MGSAIDVISKTDIVAMIGPACSDDVQIVGRLASYKGIPLVTGLGDVITDDRLSYNTLIRTSYDLRDKAKAILAFMAHYNWYQFGLIFRYHDIYYSTLADEMLSLLKDNNDYSKFIVKCKESYIRDKNKKIITNLEHIMVKIKKCARSKFERLWLISQFFSVSIFSCHYNWRRTGGTVHDVDRSLSEHDQRGLCLHVPRID